MKINHSKAVKPFRKLKILGLIMTIVILLTLISGLFFEFISYKKVNHNYPPDGHMIDVGNRKMHVNMQGAKTNLPPVIIETGTGSWSYDWLNVQEELSKYTQVITYDRAGYGWSDPPRNEFSVDMTMNDLNKVLESIKSETPVIVVGHSVGGIYARLFADKYPEKVAGLILVDSRNEFFSEKAEKFNDKFFDTQEQNMNLLLSRFGLVRLLGEYMLSDSMPAYISPEKYVSVHWDTPFFKVLDDEIKQIKINEKLLEDTQPLGEKPLTIVTPSEVELQATELGFSEQEASKLRDKWKDSQKQLTKLSTKGELIVVPNSSHSIMYDKPEVIVEAILKMADEINLKMK